MPGTVLLLAASPAGKGCLVDAASVLPVLAAVPPAILAGTDTANVVELADPLEPQAVLTRLRAAATAPGPLTLFVTGQLQLDRRQHLPHLALARTTASTVRYTALPWHWLREELRLRTPGTTTLLVDLHADAETWGWLRGHVLECGPGVSVYGRIAPPPARRTVAAPTYMKALATILRSGGRPPLPHLHHTALTRIATEGEVGDLLLHGGTGAGGFAVPVTPAPVPARPTFTGVRTTAVEPTGGSVNGAPAAGGPVPGTPADGLATAGASTAAPATGVAGAGVPATGVPPTAHASHASRASVPAQPPAPAMGVEGAGAPAGVPPAGSSMAASSEPWPPVPAQPAAPAGAFAPEASVPGQPPAPARRSAEGRPVASAGTSVPAQPAVPAAASRPGLATAPTEPPAPDRGPAHLSASVRAPGPALAGLDQAPQDPLDPHTAIALAVRDGRHMDADALAARWEAAALAAYGGGSEAVLHWSEVRADLAMFAGDAVRSCRAWLAVAAARLDAGQAVDAAAVEAAVDRAHHQWGRVTDPVRARELGPALAELRGRVPGRRRGALDHVRRQLRELQIQG
ncbi:hypothetical protein [Streptomyces antibioticus]|uniref:hypothetical protein n=1 Tax=Streptomyces antibioticus TaxID=1890 RepID=UPI002252E905|nr:hypothetical protein [Streptomyces antibioticus]MCX4737881.1 hypothetical protein [Streptomyces antibioticus]